MTARSPSVDAIEIRERLLLWEWSMAGLTAEEGKVGIDRSGEDGHRGRRCGGRGEPQDSPQRLQQTRHSIEATDGGRGGWSAGVEVMEKIKNGIEIKKHHPLRIHQNLSRTTIGQ